jgi:uncharacterized protein (DUF2336 family)
MSVVSSLILDLEDSISRGSQDRRLENLRRVTDLFLRDSEGLTDEQIDLFDVVIARLAAAIETRARAELAERLSDAPNAPRGVIRSLAHDEIVVARSVLARSERLSDDDLVAVALAKGRDHMLAITERSVLTEPVTDVLVKRGDRVVVHAVAGNPGARFSEGSIATLVDRSRADEALQTLLGQRSDLPEAHVRQLMVIAKETARRRLAEALPEASSPDIDIAVEWSATKLESVVVPGGRDYSAALAEISERTAVRPLRERDLAAYAEEGSFEHSVCALSSIVGLSVTGVEHLFKAAEADLLLVIGRAQGWNWDTVKSLLAMRIGDPASAASLKKSYETYEQLSPTTAQRVLHFLKVREASQKQAAQTAAANRQIRSKVK